MSELNVNHNFPWVPHSSRVCCG